MFQVLLLLAACSTCSGAQYHGMLLLLQLYGVHCSIGCTLHIPYQRMFSVIALHSNTSEQYSCNCCGKHSLDSM
jgi:hypothetical protein